MNEKKMVFNKVVDELLESTAFRKLEKNDQNEVLLVFKKAIDEIDALKIPDLVKEIKRLVHKPCWLTVSQASNYLGLSRRKIYELVQKNEIPSKKIDGTIIINRRQLDVKILTGTMTPGKLERSRALEYVE